MKIYMAGKVAKGEEIGRVVDWRLGYMKALAGIPSINFISPENPTLDENNPLEVFGHDCLQVRSADLVVVNAESRLGVGTAQEMVIAKYYEKYVITVLPKDTHHRRTNLQMHEFLVKDWIHPFIHTMSDEVVETLEDLASSVRRITEAPVRPLPKTLRIVDEAIDAYISGRMDTNPHPYDLQ